MGDGWFTRLGRFVEDFVFGPEDEYEDDYEMVAVLDTSGRSKPVWVQRRRNDDDSYHTYPQHHPRHRPQTQYAMTGGAQGRQAPTRAVSSGPPATTVPLVDETTAGTRSEPCGGCWWEGDFKY